LAWRSVRPATLPAKIHERAVLRQLLGELNLNGVLIQADALNTKRLFLAAPGAGGLLTADGQGKMKTPH